MILHQFYLNCLAHASYLIGDEQSATAVVVDPQRDVDQYLSFAAERGLTIRHVILTHFHADFIAGHLELNEQTGATIYLGRSAQAEYAFTPFGDGDTSISEACGWRRSKHLGTPRNRFRSSCTTGRERLCAACRADRGHAVRGRCRQA